MKLFSSFIKELLLASRGFYFYIELLMAILILALFLFVISENFDQQTTEYLYLDMPLEAKNAYINHLKKDQSDISEEKVKIKVDEEEKELIQYRFRDKVINLLDNLHDAEYLADKEREFVAVIQLNDKQEFSYQYFLQGYESPRFKNLLKILHARPSHAIETVINEQKVRTLSSHVEELSDRENLLPSVLVFNGGLMGIFIIAAYIFLDRQEGVIKALVLTPSAVWQYLLSKIGVIMVSAILSSMIVILPIMHFQVNYLLLLGLLVTSTFFAATLGLYIASFYQNIMQAFGVLYALMMVMIIPNVAYFIPSWSSSWLKWIPSYHMLEGFKTVLLGNGSWQYLIILSIGFLFSGLVLFLLTNNRYEKTRLK